MTQTQGALDVLETVRERYARSAQAQVPELCCPVDYDASLLEVLPPEIVERDYGCGDPSRFVRAGDRVLDLGSGAGKICFIASQLAGAGGHVIGVDATAEMLELARRHQGPIGERIGWHNVEFRHGHIQDLALDRDRLAAWLERHPVTGVEDLDQLRAEEQRLRREEPMIADGSIDLVLSNCVLNLVDNQDKQRLFAEIHRVLARGGRCAISDIVSDEDVPFELQRDPELWTGCISGAMREDRFVAAFAEAGLHGVEVAAYQREPWAVRGSSFQAFSDTQEILAAIARDVDSAKTSVLMEFYIWNEGGSADEVLEAVIRAAERGVSCRLLIDALGARPWWKGTQPKRLRDAGVDVRAALPVGFFRKNVGRTDLRLHRKIVVVDGAVAWTGSMNLVDPRVFKQGAGVGEWVDAMVRLEGATVAALAAVMIGDWVLETGEPFEALIESAGLRLIEPNGPADIQVVPSGPGQTADGLLQMLLALINAAQEELVLTTPYLVPDDAMIYALRGAAGRGVKVSMVLPEKVDSLMTRYASRSYYDELMDLGVEIQLYKGGLLHTKSIMVDGAMSMFGTVNLDYRSLWLNYEVALFIYEPTFAKELRALQQSYIDDADRLDPETWASRSFKDRFLENTFRLVSPLL